MGRVSAGLRVNLINFRFLIGFSGIKPTDEV